MSENAEMIREGSRAAFDRFMLNASNEKLREIMRPLCQSVWNAASEYYEGILRPMESRMALKDAAIDRAITDMSRGEDK